MIQGTIARDFQLQSTPSEALTLTLYFIVPFLRGGDILIQTLFPGACFLGTEKYFKLGDSLGIERMDLG